MSLPRAARATIETAMVNLRRAMDGSEGVSEVAHLPKGSQIYLDTWVLGYLEDFLRWDDGEFDAKSLRLGAYNNPKGAKSWKKYLQERKK